MVRNRRGKLKTDSSTHSAAASFYSSHLLQGGLLGESPIGLRMHFLVPFPYRVWLETDTFTQDTFTDALLGAFAYTFPYISQWVRQ